MTTGAVASGQERGKAVRRWARVRRSKKSGGTAFDAFIERPNDAAKIDALSRHVDWR